MKSYTAFIIIILILVFGIFFVGKGPEKKEEQSANNVSIVDGKQIIEIHAKGGYTPRTSFAKAGIPTVLRMDTGGTFDCSAFVRIPSLNVAQTLPQSGSTDIDLGTPSPGTMPGSCGMGMYPFEIIFES